jgi:hypothetical protein
MTAFRRYLAIGAHMGQGLNFTDIGVGGPFGCDMTMDLEF